MSKSNFFGCLNTLAQVNLARFWEDKSTLIVDIKIRQIRKLDKWKTYDGMVFYGSSAYHKWI